MKQIQILFYFLFLGFLPLANTQTQIPTIYETSFTDQTSDKEKFAIYLDSIDKYLYRDLEITKYTIDQCQKIIDQKVPIPDSDFFQFILFQIYNHHNKANPLSAYKTISEYEHKLDLFQISKTKKGTFNYLKAFTYMAIGDLESAQKTYYQNLEDARIQKDTSSIISSLYSLGQLYKDEKDPGLAIQSFEGILELGKGVKIRPSTATLIHIELSESLQASGETDRAMETLNLGYKIASDAKLEILKNEILIQKSTYYLENNEVAKASKIYDQILTLSKKGQDQNNKFNTTKLLANLYQAQKKYQLSINTHQEILEQIDTSNYDQLMDSYDKLQSLSFEVENFQSAHNYLLTYNEIKKKRDLDVKKQKTDYLKIKFNSEKKEKENVILAGQIVQSKNRFKILFLSLALSALVMILLFGAFYQKNKYSKNLEAEVSRRTITLKETNRELKEFNRILAHDLKEPLRSIVGFSQLALRTDKSPEETSEYLNFVITSGRQLQDLINSISAYQQIDLKSFTDFEKIDIQSFSEDITNLCLNKKSDKKIELSIDSAALIYYPKEAFSTILEKIFENAILFNNNKIIKIQVDHRLKNKVHSIKIKDNGIGINKKYHERIFEMFQRLNKRGAYKGSGLGLSIAKKMIENMNGSITLLSSKEKEGSTFLLEFPELSPDENNHAKIKTKKPNQVNT